jgi:hypothetical protein
LRAKRAFKQWWKKHVNVEGRKWGGRPGCIYKLEVGESGNIHLHVVTIGMRWIDKDWLSSTWEECSGSKVTWITSAYVSKRRTNRKAMKGIAGLVEEVSKYITKPDGGNWWVGPMAAVGLHGVRRWETFGAFRGVMASVDQWLRYRYRSCLICGARGHTQGHWMRSENAALESLSDSEGRSRAPPRQSTVETWEDLRREATGIGLAVEAGANAGQPITWWESSTRAPDPRGIALAAAKAWRVTCAAAPEVCI